MAKRKGFIPWQAVLVLVGCIGLKFENTEENPVEGDLFGIESGAVVGSKFTVFVDG